MLLNSESFPTRERGLKYEYLQKSAYGYGRSPRGNVDWNQQKKNYERRELSRSPRGNVDWNYESLRKNIETYVVPHAGTWIEIILQYWQIRPRSLSFPTRERGLKFSQSITIPKSLLSFPTRERGLKLRQKRNPGRGRWSFPTRERGLK